jgi:hypothetical protein
MNTPIGNEKDICRFFKDEIDRLNSEATNTKTRAKAGVVRAIKGTLVADITEAMVKIAWKSKGGSPYEISFDQKREILCVKEDYIKRQEDRAIRDFLYENRDKGFGYSVDKHVFIDQKLVLGIECKAYAENAMLKRILADFTLLTQSHPKMNCLLVQLENMLGGDYGNGKEFQLGSMPSHALMSQFDFDLNIITLLEGDRDVDEPVHDPRYFKPLKEKLVRNAIERIKGLLPNPR